MAISVIVAPVLFTVLVLTLKNGRLLNVVVTTTTSCPVVGKRILIFVVEANINILLLNVFLHKILKKSLSYSYLDLGLVLHT